MNFKYFILFTYITSSLNLLTIQVPIVFHKDYDISFFGIENLHPFDTKKYGKIALHLEKECGIGIAKMQKPEMINDEQLLQVHTPQYLNSLNNSKTIATIAEVPLLSVVPNFLLQRNMLNSMRYATAGTILGAKLALEHGWAINLSGGYHHAKSNNGEGFCFFADIPLAIKEVRKNKPNLKVLVVDLDAHQGNGVEEIIADDPLTFIFDMYSQNNYPRDYKVYKFINFNYPLKDHIQDKEYMELLKKELPKAIEKVKPGLIIYNAGTDIFKNDPLGKMKVSKSGIIDRDFFVFSQCIKIKIPILMVLSGGYSLESADIVSCSLENILKKLELVDFKNLPAIPSTNPKLKTKLFKK